MAVDKYCMENFLSNKYSKWYFNIIDNAKNRSQLGYVEKHHIIPKCIGGSNDHYNLVKLTAREHFICHLLLIKMTVGKHKSKMAFAARSMIHLTNKKQEKNRDFKVTSRIFEFLRKSQSKTKSSYKTGIDHPFSTIVVVDGIEYGSVLEASQKLKISRHLVRKRASSILSRYSYTHSKVTNGTFKNGKDHPKSIHVTIHGIEYGSLHEASRMLGIPRHHVKYMMIKIF
jgi:hypothetical protein